MSSLESHRSLFRRTLFWGGLVGIAGNLAEATHAFGALGQPKFLWAFAGGLAEELGYLGLSLAYASALALLFQNQALSRRLRALGAVGRMALTFYLFQTALGLFLFYGFARGPGLMGRVGAAWLVPLWVVGYGAQMWMASVWLKHYRFGPAEWLWRSLTYQRRQPFRLAAPARAAAG